MIPFNSRVHDVEREPDVWMAFVKITKQYFNSRKVIVGPKSKIDLYFMKFSALCHRELLFYLRSCINIAPFPFRRKGDTDTTNERVALDSCCINSLLRVCVPFTVMTFKAQRLCLNFGFMFGISFRCHTIFSIF